MYKSQFYSIHVLYYHCDRVYSVLSSLTKESQLNISAPTCRISHFDNKLTRFNIILALN